MTPSVRTLTGCSIFVLLAAACAACGGPPKAESASGARLPANGAPGAVASTSLPTKTLSADDWAKVTAEGMAPACDAKEGTRTADAGNLEGAGKIIGTWTNFSVKKGKSRTESGARIGEGKEPTRVVDSIGMTCAVGGSTIQVNGVLYPFDLAWVKSGKGQAKTLNGDLGAGEFAMIEAISFKDKRVVFAKVYVPSDANDDSDDTVIVTDIASYLPENPDKPIVRLIGDRDNPKFETFIASKGANEGLSMQVPQQDPLGRARFLAVGHFRH